MIVVVLLFAGAGIGLAVYCFSGGEKEAPRPDREAREEKPAPVPPTPPAPKPWLPAAEQKQVDQAVKRGVAYLRVILGGDNFQNYLPNTDYTGPLKTGSSALAGLALLNCDVPATDPAVQKAIAKVRAEAPRLNQVYDLGVCIWFLDRLGDPRDVPLIRTLALRLVAGQSPQGGWPYQCPALAAADEPRLLALLRSKSLPPADAPERLKNLPVLRFRPGEKPTLGAPAGVETNSLTLFAMLGLWVAQKHGVPAQRSLALAEARFRASQLPNGSWQYQFGPGNYTLYDSMTCAGLLALALGRGAQTGKHAPLDKDPAVAKAFGYLAGRIGRPAVRRTPGTGPILGANAYGDMYFLWAVERLAVVYNRRQLGGTEWYRWGVGVLLPTQNADGSWSERYAGAVDTSFALLFLKRANVAKDLTEKLQLGD
jgi:hypothetical protein